MIGRAQLSEIEEHLENPEQTAPADMAEEREVRRVVDEIDNLCDLKEWEILRSYLADEVEVDFTSLAAGDTRKVSADDLINYWKTDFFAGKRTFHQRTNHRVEIRGDQAEVFSKCHSLSLSEETGSAEPREEWAFYNHSLERAEDSWKLTAMSISMIHQRGE